MGADLLLPLVDAVAPATRFRSSTQVGDLAAALAKAQGSFEAVGKDRENPHMRYRYATLASVLAATRKGLSQNGIAVTHEYNDGYLVTRLLCGEQWLESEARVALDQGKGLTQVQALGSALTYLRRYCLSGLLGVAPDDDDDGAGADGVVVDQGAPPRHETRPAPQQERREPARAAVAPQAAPVAAPAGPPDERVKDDETRAVLLLREARSVAELGQAGSEVQKLTLSSEARQRCLELYRELKAALQR